MKAKERGWGRGVRGQGYAALVAAVVWCLGIPPAAAADLSITAANVKLGGTATQTRIETVTAGETVAAGEVVYYDTDTDKVLLADNASVTRAEVYGVVLVGASTGGAAQVVTEGPIYLGASVATGGMNYVVSATDGKIAPVADLASAKYISSIGHATSASILWVYRKSYRVAKP